MKLNHRWTPSWRATRSLLAVGFVAVSLAACDSTDPTPKAVGNFTTLPAGMRPEDVTPDGSTILLTDLASASADFYFYNTSTNTNVLAGSAGDAMYDWATGISSNLSVSAVHGKPEQPGLWSQASGWTDLGNIYPAGCEFDDVTHEQDQGSAWDVSADGSVTVGLAWNLCNATAFMHTGSGFVSLDVLGKSSRATVVSDDGLVAGGWSEKIEVVGTDTFDIDRWPSIWHANGAGFQLTAGAFTPPASPGEILSITPDGSMVAGTWGTDGFYWTQASGAVSLGRLSTADPSDRIYPNAIAADGKLIFGGIGDAFSLGFPTGFVWTQAAGMRSLQEVLTAGGVKLPEGFLITLIVGASADGTVLTGVGYDANFMEQYFVLKAPVSVYGIN